MGAARCLGLDLGRPTPADTERRSWREAERHLADGQSLPLGAEERDRHARLRQQAMLIQDPLLDRLRHGEMAGACGSTGPAMADSFCTLHL